MMATKHGAKPSRGKKLRRHAHLGAASPRKKTIPHPRPAAPAMHSPPATPARHPPIIPVAQVEFERADEIREALVARSALPHDSPAAHPLHAPAFPMSSPVHQASIHHPEKYVSATSPSPLHKFYLFISKFSSRSQRRALKQKLQFAGIPTEAEIWLGQVFMLAFLCAAMAFLLVWVLFREIYLFNLLAFSLLAFATVLLGAVVHLSVQTEDRRKRLEDVLPDAMQVIAANIRAGMTPIVALRAAARPELGPLQEDIKLATTKSLGTESFTDALHEMAQKTSSDLFQRIVSLFSASLKSGGHLAQLLENTASDIRETQELKRDLVANTRLYAIFIVFTVVIGTPLLLAVSIQFSGMVSALQARTSTGGIASEISSGPLISSPLSLDFLFSSALIIIIITCALASALLGVLNDGSYFSGLKYAPFLSAAAILFFFLMKDYVLKAILPVS